MAENPHPEPSEGRPRRRFRARDRGPARRDRVGESIAGARELGTESLRATAERAGPVMRRPTRRARSGLAGLAGLLASMVRTIGTRLGGLLAAPLRLAVRLERRAERTVRPDVTVLAVTAAACAALAVSQFLDYRGVQIGAENYRQVAGLAPPPLEETATAGSAHGYALVPIAAVALLLAVVSVLTGRWRLGRLVALAGAAGLAITLLIDRPKGLDEGTAGVAFAGAEATLTKGFYLQLVSSGTLVVCGLLVGLWVRRSRRRQSRARRAPEPVAEGAP